MFCPHILIWWGHTPIRHKHIFEVRLVSVLLDCVLLVVLTSVWMWIWGEFSIVTNGNVINRIMSGVLSSRSDNHQDRKSVFQQIFQVIKNLRRKRKNVIYRQSCFYAECFFPNFPGGICCSLNIQEVRCASDQLPTHSHPHDFAVILMSFLNTNKSILFIMQK